MQGDQQPQPALTVAFDAHVDRIRRMLALRAAAVEGIQALLNAGGKPAAYRQDRALLSRRFAAAMMAASGAAEDSSPADLLRQAHWARGFRPHAMAGMHNDLVDPAEMMMRAFNLWKQTRWPGRNGRVRYAQALFNLCVLRELELLVMRIWDGGGQQAQARLSSVQHLLDALWQSSPADQPRLVRDARWLLPVAQSPTTHELAPYFDVAADVDTWLPEEDRIEIHKATVVLAGGHLRSQLRYYHMRGAPLDDPALVLTSRRSNALDFAMTIHGLVTLLRAYSGAVEAGDMRRRHALAGAILQGISPDPQMFVNRTDLLGPCSMIELLFTATEGEAAGYTPMGRHHLQMLRDYIALMERMVPALFQDCPHFAPRSGRYSPLGVMYGFSSNITEHMALKTVQQENPPGFTLEDAFTGEDEDGTKLAWVSGWRRLPHVPDEVLQQYAYPQQFAEEIFERIAAALRWRVEGSGAGAAVDAGAVFVAAAGSLPASAEAANLPAHYFVSTDPQVVAGYRARAVEEASFLHDRQEGEYMVSYPTSGGWMAITKDFLTTELEAGRSVKVEGLPASAAAVLRLMCLELAAD